MVQAVVKATRGPGAEVRTVPDPTPGEDEVLVAVRASSVCGTDVHIWLWNHWAQSRMKTIPLIFGHELSGEVLQVGRRVKNLAVGDHVSAETHIADGTCYQCRNGKMHICENVQVLGVDRNGVFAEFAVLPARNAWKNDPSLDPAIAAIQEPLGNAVHSLLPEDNIEDLAGKNVLVTGCGPIGLLAIVVARTLGARAVFATEVNPLRSGLALKMGADRVLNPTTDGAEVLRTILSETGGHGVDVAVEMSGHPASLKLAFDALTPGGRVSLLGLFDKEASFEFRRRDDHQGGPGLRHLWAADVHDLVPGKEPARPTRTEREDGRDHHAPDADPRPPPGDGAHRIDAGCQDLARAEVVSMRDPVSFLGEEYRRPRPSASSTGSCGSWRGRAPRGARSTGRRC